MDKLYNAAAKSDAALSKRYGYSTAQITEALSLLLNKGQVEVGHRESCGRTDPTVYAKREWEKLLKVARKAGLVVNETNVKHANGWATKAQGFWSSSIYTLGERESG